MLLVRKTTEEHSPREHTSHVDGLPHLLEGPEITHQIPLKT